MCIFVVPSKSRGATYRVHPGVHAVHQKGKAYPSNTQLYDPKKVPGYKWGTKTTGSKVTSKARVKGWGGEKMVFNIGFVLRGHMQRSP